MSSREINRHNPDQQSTINDLVANPFLTVPPEYADLLVPFWLKNHTALGTGIELCAMTLDYISDDGLTVTDLREALKTYKQWNDHNPQTTTSGVLKMFISAVVTTMEARKRLEKQMQARTDYWPEEKPGGKSKHAEHPFPPSPGSSDVPYHLQVVTSLAESFRSGEYIEPVPRIQHDRARGNDDDYFPE